MPLTSRFESQVLSAFLAASLVVIGLTVIAWQMGRQAMAAQVWVQHTQGVLRDLARVQGGTHLIELHTQAYRISGEPARLQDRNVAMAARESDMQHLRDALVDNPAQLAQWQALREVIDQRIAISRRVEQLRKEDGLAAATAYAASAPLGETRARFQRVLDRMEADETERLRRRTEQAVSAGQRLVAVGALTALALLLLLGGSYSIIRRQLRRTEVSRQALADNEVQLERRVAERTRQLQAKQQELSRVLEGSDQGYWTWDLPSNDFRVSARWETMLGYAPGEMNVAPDNWHALVHPSDLPVALESIQQHLDGATPRHEVELRVHHRQGGWRWILTRGRVVERASDGTALTMSGTHTDITERKHAELAQRQSAAVFDNSDEGIMVADADGLITQVNPAFTRITGYEAHEVIGRSPGLLSSGRHDAAFYEAFWSALQQRGFWNGEIWNRRKSGDVFPVLQSITTVRDAGGRVQHHVSVFTDISRLKAHEAELDRVAHFDALTGLPNRRLLTDRLAQAVLRASRSGRHGAICFIDLDGFKAVNDAHGHATGDQLLIGIGEHIKAVLRPEDTLSRLGGDEFVLLLTELGSIKETTQILDRVLHAARQPVAAEDHLLSLSASIGVSLFPNDDDDPDTLLRHADQTMYLAKQAGKNRYQLFDPEVDRVAQQRRDQLTRLREALRVGEFELYYQPKVDLRDGSVTGAEGLIRWLHPERGLIAPGEFLPVLQGSDLEAAVGEWVIDCALSQIVTWKAQGLHLPVSVNISPRHLIQPAFAERLASALARHPCVDARDFQLEVLETAAIADMQQAADILQRCMALGIDFALDDFGTGYSSLTYLRKLPARTLKIDRSFVSDLLDDPEDHAIVRGVIDLARAFDREVIAEGVETLAHGKALLAMGCHLAQGYGIARPMPAGDLIAWRTRWLSQWQPLRMDTSESAVRG
ncbi:EAL domain-containing protein [Sphaerotilus mobilis]|uniref:PAS domain S-box-containing protein/diguanylate cyclase (GGDEF)-like protein n=1 Tax=Sphaerotilus mobilis TaxID=47994 RepID=A0A4Q7LH67_9BURK|nr:EAL domain-containing protein [Sphaerotilus mobilis]RZS53383.1 PAS domain S-box-containing protein/diguanylate cyclase (GGDEF)-like protein [Sphaerotilus mobilis]